MLSISTQAASQLKAVMEAQQVQDRAFRIVIQGFG